MATLNYTAGNLAQQTAERIFEREFMPHLNAVKTFAYYLIRDGEDAEDLAQVTFLKAWQFIHRYAENTNAKAWLFRICKHAFINEYRTRKVAPKKVDHDDIVVFHNEDTDNPRFGSLYSEMEFGVFSDEVTLALAQLKEEHRALVLLEQEDFSYEEMAAILAIPIGTVRSRLHRARKHLAALLGNYATEFGYGVQDQEQGTDNGGDLSDDTDTTQSA